MPRHCCPTGRVNVRSQKCHCLDTLPHQFNGDTDMTQRCLDHNSPRERSVFHRSNATTKTPLPTSLTGAITTSQKCYKVNAPREGSTTSRRNANRGLPFPTIYRGPSTQRRNAIDPPPPPNLGHSKIIRNDTLSSPNNQRPVQTRRNANPPSPRNIKRKTNGQEIRKPNHRKDTVCMAQPPKHGQS